MAGNVGSRSRFEYAVIGDAVNAAARLTELAKDVEGRVPVSSASVDLAEDGEQAHWAPDGSPVLRGQDTPTPTSRLA